MLCSLQYRLIWNACFYHGHIAVLPIRVVKNSVVSVKICTMLRLPNMQELKLSTLHWRSVAGCSREYIDVVFACNGSEYLKNQCLQPFGTYITQDVTLKIVDTDSENRVVPILLSLSPIEASNSAVIHNRGRISIQLPYLQNQKLLTLHSRSCYCIVHWTSAAINNRFHYYSNWLVVFVAD
jgi:hypothetical protein